MSCRRESCPFHHTRHEFSAKYRHCCNACAAGEPTHTNNCSGAGQRVVGVAAAATPHAAAGVATETRYGVQVPRHWWAGNSCDSIRKFLRWYMGKFDFTLNCEVAWLWADLEADLRLQQSMMHRRPLKIYVEKEDNVARDSLNNLSQINVHKRGLDGHWRGRYYMQERTGLDFDVQAYLLSQHKTPAILLEACQNIEAGDMKEFTFVCRGATHRSVGMACLLSMIIYPCAVIHLSTPRTINAARDKGLPVRR